MIAGLNQAIQASEDFINGAIGLVNDFTSLVNEKIGTEIGALGGVTFDQLANPGSDFIGKKRAF